MIVRWRHAGRLSPPFAALLVTFGVLSLTACNSSKNVAQHPPQPNTLVVFSGGGTLAVDTTSGAVQHLQGPLKDLLYVPSPDGRELVFACGDDGTAYIDGADQALCSYDSNGFKQLTHSTDLVRPGFTEDAYAQLEASWSGDSRRVAFLVRERASTDVYSSGDIYVADLETKAVKRVAEGAFAELRGPMAWSPDGRHIVVRNSQRLGGGDQLLALDTTTGQSTSYANDLATGLVEQYVWAPDSSAIAFTWNDGSVHLYVATIAGGALRDLGPAWGGTPPAWSPDGRWIAATQVPDVFSSAFITRTDGSGRRQIAGDLHQSNNPTWAPDSKHLAFAGSPSGEFNDRHLFVTDNTGGTPRELAKDTTLAFSPLIAFSNDSQRLLFTADAAGCFEGCPPGYLFMIDVEDGPPEVRLHDQPVSQFLGWLP